MEPFKIQMGGSLGVWSPLKFKWVGVEVWSPLKFKWVGVEVWSPLKFKWVGVWGYGAL